MNKTLPERLQDYRVYLDGKTDLIGTSDIQLPSLQSMVETVKGAGIAGEYESPTLGHFQSMKLTLNWRTLNVNQLTLSRQKAQRFDCRGANQVYDSSAGEYKTQSIRVVVHGPTTSNDLGRMESSATSDGSTEVEALYFKVTVDDKTIIEIDKLAYICVIDGVDYLKDVRKALGL